MTHSDNHPPPVPGEGRWQNWQNWLLAPTVTTFQMNLMNLNWELEEEYNEEQWFSWHDSAGKEGSDEDSGHNNNNEWGGFASF
jgi:hypothetical protein